MKDYTISELRRITDSYVNSVMKTAINEAWQDHPSYEDIKNAYRPEPGSEAATVKVIPTEEFLSLAYSIFNREFFNGALPKGLSLEVETETKENRYGFAGYRWWSGRSTITPTKIRLNSKYRMTFHEWLEVILHECVHIFEYVTHPEPFTHRTRGGRVKYDAHGAWFLEHGARFDEYGFNVRKYCMAVSGTYDINLSDSGISKKYSKEKSQFLIATMIGVNGEHGGADVKISRSFKPKFEHILSVGKKYNSPWWSKIEKVVYSTTDNPFFINWNKISPRDYDSGFKYKNHDYASEKYGPYMFESEFVPSLDAMNNEESMMLSDILSNENRLCEKIFRCIVGRRLVTDWETSKYAKYITPTIKLRNGMLLDCAIGFIERKDKLVFEPSKSRIYINEEFVNSLRERFGGGFSPTFIMDDYEDYMSTGTYSRAQSINMAIDNAIEDDEYETNGKMDAIREAVSEFKSANMKTTSNESVGNEITEDIDEMPIEDRNIGASEEYAKHMYDDVKGVSGVRVNGDGTVDVEIW